MDYYLDIIMNEKELENAGLTEKLCEWNGEKYSYNPAQYITDSAIEFERIKDIQHSNKLAGIQIPMDIIGLSLKSDLLHDLDYAINCDLDKLTENPLFLFLTKLSELSMIYIFLVREDEK